ncbi:hypothetical protein D3C87_2038900 [compost metagenome]
MSIVSKSFSPQEIDEIDTYIRVGEFGLALESICFLINENEIPIDSNTKNLAISLASRMELEIELDP